MTYIKGKGLCDFYVREAVLPGHIRGATIDDEDGNHNVYINSSLPDDQKIKTLIHEMCHGENGHMSDDTKSVEEKETEASGNTQEDA